MNLLQLGVRSLLAALALGLSSGAAKPTLASSADRSRSVINSRAAWEGEAELARLRADAIEKIMESRTKYLELLDLYRAEKKGLAEEFAKRQELYRQGIISQAELATVERALANSIRSIMEVEQSIVEDDLAVAEVTLRDEILRSPGLRTHSGNGARPVRFDGSVPWSLAEAPKIEAFFIQAFGRSLPVSAFGQSSVHNRLRLDHRDAMDVAVHPESKEGRSLMSFLRQSGIPFVAFHGSMPGASTGAHIHVGKPSARN